MRVSAINALDSYKLSHHNMYPDGTEFVYSNLTARGSRIEGVDEVVFFGLQAFMMDFLIDDFNDTFFNRPKEGILRDYQRRVNNLLGPDNGVGTEHIAALHDLGHLPLKIRALPEGSRVPLRVPMLTIENTDPAFYWLTNYLETVLSNYIWMAITSATTTDRFRRLLDSWADKTGADPVAVNFCGHDFSLRGLSSLQSGAMSGAAHLLSSWGTDNLPGIELLENFYNAGSEGEVVGASVAASEHSIMTAYGQDNEIGSFEELMNRYPSGILSVVSDSWDLFKVLTEYLPQMYDRIMAREGTLVIRPDSGDPANIICGDPDAAPGTPERAGVIEILWEHFGGTFNEAGFKVLDAHVGAIYGDSITYDRANDIMSRLADKGFVSTSCVFGVGSYTYQYVTRDTFGFAVKATQVTVNGKDIDIFKAPKTDTGLKNSAKGRLCVVSDPDGKLILREGVSRETEDAYSLLRTVFIDGDIVNEHLSTLSEIRARLGH